MKQTPHAGPPRRPGVVRRTQLLLDAETREMLDEYWERRGGTLHAAATEVIHAGLRVLAEQRAALDSFDVAEQAEPDARRSMPGAGCFQTASLTGKGYGPFGGAL